MPKPPAKKTTQKHFVQSAIRFPPELREDLKAAADNNGRSFNAEVIARLQASPLEEVLSELADVKALVRKILDQM